MFDRHGTLAKMGPSFEARAADSDAQDRFVFENYRSLKECRAFSAMIPEELGGGGLPFSEMCHFIREISHRCSSTALAFSMHQHLTAAAVWNYRRGNPGEMLLRRVAGEELVLVSTGATDWLGSTGLLQPCEGGFRYSGTKRFASGSPAGDLLIMTGRFHDPEGGWQVLHFTLSIRAEGVRVNEDWNAMGMRGTGSNTVVIENAFVPAEAVGLRRPLGKYHGVWNVVFGVAWPLIGAAYLGIAESAARIAIAAAAGRCDEITAIVLGEMQNHLTMAQLAHRSLVELADELRFEPSLENSSQVLIRRTLLTQAVIDAAAKAMEATRGAGYFRGLGLERLLRDALAGQFHTLQAKQQQRFSGRVALGLDVDELPPGRPA